MASSSDTMRHSPPIDRPNMNVVLCGSDSRLKSSVLKLILSQSERRSEPEDEEMRSSDCVRLNGEVCGHLMTLVELPALFNPLLSDEEMMRQALSCVSLCDSGVHVFLLIIDDGPLTDEDKAETEKIQRIFSSRINKHTMILIIQKSENNTVELNKEMKSVVESFGGRHEFLCLNTQVSMLMEKLMQMMEDNSRCSYSTETFWDAQLEKLLKFEEMKRKQIQTQDVRDGSDDVRIVLLGKTGAGKSATGNTILGRKAFKSNISQWSITKECQRETVEVNSRRITVIDTPGLFDTELSQEEIQREMTECISMILPGPHVFIIVINLGHRFTKEEEESVKIIQETFGKNSLMYTMILFTRGDDLKDETIEEFLGTRKSPLRNLIDQCGNRYHVFNNTEIKDHTQVSALLEKIDDMVKANGGSYYSSKIFRKMEREKQEQQIKILMEKIEQLSREKEEEKERMKMIMEEEKQKHEQERKKRDDEFIEREERYKREMKEQEKQLRDEMRRERETLKNEIKEIKKTIKENKDLQIKYTTQIDKLMNTRENERQNHERERKRREDEFRETEERYKREMMEQKRETQEEIRREREILNNEIEEIKKENKDMQITFKKEKERTEREREDFQLKHNTEIERMKVMMEEERENHEKERKKREEEFIEREERYKREMKEQEKQLRDEMRREQETLKNEIEEIKKENKDLQTTFIKEKEKTDREREDLLCKHETEIEKMKMMMEEERQNHEKERKKKEEEFIEREERYKREMEQQREMQEEMRRERYEREKQDEKLRKEEEDQKRKEKEEMMLDQYEKIKKEKERTEREREDLQLKHNTELERMKKMEEDRQKHERERQKREEEFKETEERYKREMMEQEKQLRDEMRRERETLNNEIEEKKKENKDLQITYDKQLMDTREKQHQNYEREIKRREEEFMEREERKKREIMEQKRQMEDEKKTEQERYEREKEDERLRTEEEDYKRKEKEQMMLDQYEKIKKEKERTEREKEDLQLKYSTEIERMKKMLEEEKLNHQREKKNRKEQYREKMKEIETKTQKQMQDDERRREEEKQNWREKQEMLEKMIQNEKHLKEEQSQIYEDKIQLIKQQCEDKLMRVKSEEYEDRRRDIERIKICCYQTDSSHLIIEPRISKQLENLFSRLNLTNRHQDKLRTEDFLKITNSSLQSQEPQKETELVNSFLHKLLNMNYRARETHIKHREEDQQTPANYNPEVDFDIHVMDVQMAVFHCADSFLKQLMVTKLSQCQFALPLLVPHPFTQQIEFPLWTFRQINKSWKMRNNDNEIISKVQPVYKAETPMVSFFRFGSLSSSKSQLINSLINEKHNTFFHRNCSGSSRTRLLMDGVVEIAWYCPSGKNTDTFTDCVAFCNLHGDAGDNEKQYEILTSMSSVNVLFLSDFGQKNQYKGLVRSLFRSPQPLICLLTDNECDKTELTDGKFIIGLLNKNQSELSNEIRETIRGSLKDHKKTFKLEDVARHTGIQVDENNEECQRGKEAALQMMRSLDDEDPSTVKETNLPYQGKLWHDWCKINKELRHLGGENLEEDKSAKLNLMKEIREKQMAQGSNEFMKMFSETLRSLKTNKKRYFLTWMINLLDDFTSKKLYKLHKEYDVKWNEVSGLNKIQDKQDQVQIKQTELEEISDQINKTTFGLDHIVREVGQIYESWSSVKKNNFSDLPSLAAEMMLSGFPLELMDGDAAHVPLIWIKAVFDQLIQKLGDQRVFVLSVLGLQSSGKSTLLNAMFGLQFSVSAGRCTRGAFMQLIRVSEEMKQQLKFDFILVVDTEGLRASELDGRSTKNHDNELATFVVGIGNLTLINIMGENPSEMQDILQIVVQAFMRMKKVRLNPSCVFVHQNVSDVTAGEKNMEGRRRLQETLDEMTKLAAKEEVCDAEYFSDVIAFDVQKDVKYFAQLWEGSPPMAPPNPNYCENVLDLKKSILTHASKSNGIMLTHLRGRIEDLWEALLNEQFVFSFKNTLEITTYRKIETEYSKWSWSLRSAMLEIENKLHNRIENEAVHEVKETYLQRELNEKSEEVKKKVSEFFEKDRDAGILNQWKTSFEIKIKELQENIVRETKKKLNQVLQQREMKKKIDAQRTQHENSLFEKSKELAMKLKDKANDENIINKQFDSFWERQMGEIIRDTPPVKNMNTINDVTDLLTNIYESLPVDYKKISSEYIDMLSVPSYSDYVKLKKSSGYMGHLKNAYKGVKRRFGSVLSTEDEIQIRTLINEIADDTDKMIQSYNIAKMGYNISCIQQLMDYIKKKITDHEEEPKVKYVFKREFFRDLVVCICQRANKTFTDQHRLFREANDPVLYFKRKKEEYYKIFQKYCQGATSATITAEFICNKFKETIEQNVYKTIARDLADEMRSNCESLNGNRSKLEKHILKRLANEEDFKAYMTYIQNPRDHFKSFIRDEVSKYITVRFHDSVQPKMVNNITQLQKKIINAAQESTKHIQEINGDVHSWLTHFTHLLSDVLVFSVSDLTGVKIGDVDVTVLKDVIIKEIPAVISDIRSRFTEETFLVKLNNTDRPDEILINHLCQCCWVQCPFCAAICTNTIEDHDGDHSVSFHRNTGLNGWHYRGTTNLAISICTSSVASDRSFYPDPDSDVTCLWKEYRKGGPKYAKWSITPDLSELPYWKWFVCKFQKNLEEHYKKTFEGNGTIPDEWRKYSNEEAIESLDKYM